MLLNKQQAAACGTLVALALTALSTQLGITKPTL